LAIIAIDPACEYHNRLGRRGVEHKLAVDITIYAVLAGPESR